MQIITPQANQPVLRIVQDTWTAVRKITKKDVFVTREIIPSNVNMIRSNSTHPVDEYDEHNINVFLSIGDTKVKEAYREHILEIFYKQILGEFLVSFF